VNSQEYWDKEGCRLLTDYNNRVPTTEERVKAAYHAGFAEGCEHSLSFETTNKEYLMLHDLIELMDYHQSKANSFKGCIRTNHWEPGQKDAYAFHIRSLELLRKLKEDLEK